MSLVQNVVLSFCFEQKTAYDMRISDWSSDVCSSDLLTDDTAIGMLEQLLDAIGRLKEIGDAQEDWDLRQKWVQAQIGKLWQRRGLYPGLLTVMDLLDAEASIQNAKWYCDRREEKKAYALFFDSLDGGKDCPDLKTVVSGKIVAVLLDHS